MARQRKIPGGFSIPHVIAEGYLAGNTVESVIAKHAVVRAELRKQAELALVRGESILDSNRDGRDRISLELSNGWLDWYLVLGARATHDPGRSHKDPLDIGREAASAAEAKLGILRYRAWGRP